MLQIWNALRTWMGTLEDEDGASLVEYALLVALIAIVAIAAVVLLGQNVSSTLSSVSDSLP